MFLQGVTPWFKKNFHVSAPLKTTSAPSKTKVRGECYYTPYSLRAYELQHGWVFNYCTHKYCVTTEPPTTAVLWHFVASYHTVVLLQYHIIHSTTCSCCTVRCEYYTVRRTSTIFNAVAERAQNKTRFRSKEDETDFLWMSMPQPPWQHCSWEKVKNIGYVEEHREEEQTDM